MSRGYSLDLWTRVVACVAARSGGTVRGKREFCGAVDAAVCAVRERRRQTERWEHVAAKPSGGSTSPLEAHAAWLLELVAKHPDLTLDEIVAAVRREGIAGSRGQQQMPALQNKIVEALPIRHTESRCN